MVAKPVGIRTVLSSVPSWTGHDGGDPRRYFKLGRFTMGNTDGFQFSHGIEYGQQLLYPMPAVWELLAYDIKNGASCLFQELVDVPDLSLKQPWDRNPSLFATSALPSMNGGTGATTAVSFTVPVGRRLMLSQASLWARRITAASAAGTAYAYISIAGGVRLYRDSSNNTPGVEMAASLTAGPLYLGPGTVISGTYGDSDTGGSWQLSFDLQGMLFDA